MDREPHAVRSTGPLIRPASAGQRVEVVHAWTVPDLGAYPLAVEVSSRGLAASGDAALGAVSHGVARARNEACPVVVVPPDTREARWR